MDKRRVLVFPAGTEIGLELQRALGWASVAEVFGANSVSDHCDFVFARCDLGVPYVTAEGFLDRLVAEILRRGIDYVFPAQDDVLLTLVENRDRLHATLIAPDTQTVRVCRSKKETYAHLAGEPFVPRTFASPAEVSRYPVFVKPDIGQASRGARKVESPAALLYELQQNQGLVISEYLPGPEYTVDCFTDRHGTLLLCKLRDRTRIRGGISVRSRILPMDQKVQAIADVLNRRLRFKGGWFFQLKRNGEGDFRLLEIAPRVAGTMGLTRNIGLNIPLLTLYAFMDVDVSLIENHYSLEVDRALVSRFRSDLEYDGVYLDLDDTLILRGQVNTFLMMFLYQAVNARKRIVLLTRHAGIVDHILTQHRICPSLFDSIVHLQDGQRKSDHITEPRAILIDDSFSERKEVSENRRIPVFDLDAVEMLIDWRM